MKNQIITRARALIGYLEGVPDDVLIIGHLVTGRDNHRVQLYREADFRSEVARLGFTPADVQTETSNGYHRLWVTLPGGVDVFATFQYAQGEPPIADVNRAAALAFVGLGGGDE